MCTRASVSVCVFVIVPFSLAAGAATPGQAGGESERGVGEGVGGAAAGETVWYMRLSLATLRHTRIGWFNKDITQTK